MGGLEKGLSSYQDGRWRIHLALGGKLPISGDFTAAFVNYLQTFNKVLVDR